MPFTRAQLLEFAVKFIEKNKKPDCLLRLTLSRGIGAPGYSPRNAKNPMLVMSLRPVPKIGHGKVTKWNLMASSFRLLASDSIAHFKTCNKLSQVLARAEADAAGADEALLLNTDGFIVEGASSNLFWMKHGIIHTPPLTAGILAGVTRALVFEIASQLGIPLRETNIRLKDLAQTEGVFLSLSSLGIVEAKSLNAKALKRSPLTVQIARAYIKNLKDSSACNPGSEP